MRNPPLATYRLQLRAELDFSAAAELVDYLADLGISHLYCSPVMRATPGSPHGYDVTDPTCPNPELGGLPGFRLLAHVARERGLGLLLDFVPNHMAITGPENRWWWDVLENGPASRFASFFDVDWQQGPRPHNRVLLPVLAEPYGRVLARGEIRIALDGGRFVVTVGDRVYPMAPPTADGLLREAARHTGSSELGFLADAHAALPRSRSTDTDSVERRHRDKNVLAELLARLCAEAPAVRHAVEQAAERCNADREALHALLERQNYRLAYWRTASSELDYRRFFDVSDLVGVRVEDARVFAHAHELLLDWLVRGEADGVRIDHVDGLRDPEGYLAKLLAAAPESWVIVEKILARDEQLPPHWRIAGTTGYDFLARSLDLLIDPDAEGPLTAAYQEESGDARSWSDVLQTAKRRVISDLFGSDLARLTELFAGYAASVPEHRDLARRDLEAALEAALIALPVYRTYLRDDEEQPSAQDAAVLDRTFAAARAARPEIDPAALDLLEQILRRRLRGHSETELALRWQQLSAAVMAKGAEDTAGYAYPRFAALCEVGCDPGVLGSDLARFHQANAAAAARAPHALLATSTHDTKRSEDVRARLALLSEIPELWARTCRRWSTRNAVHRGTAGPDPKAEYLLYQTWVGAWPIETERLVAYALKAAREAKEHTSWLAPDAPYERDLEAFVRALAEDPVFMTELERFVAPLVEPGRRNALAVTLLKLTAPGIPDIYQGCELWDHSLVDPDNRRPVDFALRRTLLKLVREASAGDALKSWDEGLPKLFLIQRVLAERARHPERFDARSGYWPLIARGAAAEHAVAFTRRDLVCLVPRLSLRLRDDWAGTTLALPAGRWYDVMTGAERRGGPIEVAGLLADFPVCLLGRTAAS